ncbi:MAG: hypothetical protein VX290_09595 [Candidatus Latescibacterota bacterium]|nr:hypothetical protein [Candidatus Latescibacterota bacterium]
MKILITEDEALMRIRLEAQFKAWDFDVVSCADDQQAWDILSSEERIDTADRRHGQIGNSEAHSDVDLHLGLQEASRGGAHMADS